MRQMYISRNNLTGEYIVYDGDPKAGRKHFYPTLEKFLSSVENDLKIKPSREIGVRIDKNSCNGQSENITKGLESRFSKLHYQ